MPTEWSDLLADHNVPGSFGAAINSILLSTGLVAGATYATAGTVNDAAPTTTLFKTNLTEDSNFWKDAIIVFQTGALYRQSRPIKSFTQPNGVIELGDPTTSVVANGTSFLIKATHQDSNDALETMGEEIRKILKADWTIDKNVTPWRLMVYESGTATLLFTKELQDVDGNDVLSTRQVVGRVVAP